MKSKKQINNDSLLKIGFKHNYIESENGFYSLYIGNVFYLTVCFKKMKTSLHKKGIGHIIEFKNIDTIEDIEKLISIIE